ncbi:alpha/beta-hydrolase family protein [Mesorhizobium sp.]|uniref:alpha/beta hydrolase n=1 Tax=Mesorhizobium sp. TaxID=1871066 RepID=UPI0025F77CAE|nr:alpha/beta-hydrolase family protein [Mesorhizobium sp.]
MATLSRMALGHALSLSGTGLVAGTLFFAASLTPTLVPRTYMTQGVLAGCCFAVGYGAGVAARWLWRYLEIPELRAGARSVANALLAVICLGVAITFLWRSAGWQNSIRAVMGMPPVDSAHPLKVSAIALATFVVLLVAARIFAALVRFAVGWLRGFVPRRIANVAGFAIAAFLVWSIGSNTLVPAVFRALDSSYSKLDQLIEPERPQPTADGKTGSPASLVKWEELGRAGREFIAEGPGAAEIGAFTGRPAREPIRVYVGLGAASDARARAKLALAELERVGGFDRSALVVITPTGTGWVDPASMDALEYLQQGDVASVAVQYSYLSSPLSLLAQPEYGAETARALFQEIYGRWTTLPKDKRPKLYLHGLSLGAMNSERSAGLFEILGDPIDGALWSGPPFESRVWRSVTDARDPTTPEWLPVFRDSRLVRFMNQSGPAVPPDKPWGPLRVVYLQYASDPIVFFSYRDAYRQPDWMKAPRGPDVSPELGWYPVVTMLQLGLDMAVATTTPIGHGHVYAPQDYVEAWFAVLGAQDWSSADIARLKQHLAEKAAARSGGGGG